MTSKLVSLHESLISKANTTIQKEPFKLEIVVRKKILLGDDGAKGKFYHFPQIYDFWDLVCTRQRRLRNAMELEFFFQRTKEADQYSLYPRLANN